MKRTMYEAARHTPKRQATGSNPAGGAKMTAVSRFSMVYSGFLSSFPWSMLAAPPKRFFRRRKPMARIRLLCPYRRIVSLKIDILIRESSFRELNFPLFYAKI